MAFVPAPASAHDVPSARLIMSDARVLRRASPSIHSGMPAASVTMMSCMPSSAMSPTQRRISGTAAASGWTSHRAATSTGSATRGAMRLTNGSTPASCDRRHDSTMGPRGPDARGAPAVTPSPRKRSQLRRTSRARDWGGVAASIASHGLTGMLILPPLTVPGCARTRGNTVVPAALICNAPARRESGAAAHATRSAVVTGAGLQPSRNANAGRCSR